MKCIRFALAAVLLMSIASCAQTSTFRLPCDTSCDPTTPTTPAPTPAPTPTPTPTILVSSPYVVFAGDSILGSEGGTLATDYGNANYYDAGVYGYTSSRLLGIFPYLISGNPVCYGFVSDPEPAYPTGLNCTVLPQMPGVIVVYIGWNNIFSISPPSTSLAESTFATVISDLTSMIGQARSANVQIVICTLYHSDPAYRFSWSPNDPDPYGPWTTELNSDIRNLASSRGIPIADLEKSFSGLSNYTVDGTHPNAFGFSQMKATIAPVLSRYVIGASPR